MSHYLGIQPRLYSLQIASAFNSVFNELMSYPISAKNLEQGKVHLLSHSVPSNFTYRSIFNDKTRNEANLSMLHHVHFTFVFQSSLSAFHQIIRQRTWNIS